jgi:hypothetical protein
MLSPALIGDQVIEVRQSCQKRLLASARVMKPFHGEQLPLDGIMGLIQEGARGRHLGVLQHRIPAGFLFVKPASHALAIRRARRVDNVVGEVA